MKILVTTYIPWNQLEEPGRKEVYLYLLATTVHSSEIIPFCKIHLLNYFCTSQDAWFAFVLFIHGRYSAEVRSVERCKIPRCPWFLEVNPSFAALKWLNAEISPWETSVLNPCFLILWSPTCHRELPVPFNLELPKRLDNFLTVASCICRSFWQKHFEMDST